MRENLHSLLQFYVILYYEYISYSEGEVGETGNDNYSGGMGNGNKGRRQGWNGKEDNDMWRGIGFDVGGYMGRGIEWDVGGYMGRGIGWDVDGDMGRNLGWCWCDRVECSWE